MSNTEHTNWTEIMLSALFLGCAFVGLLMLCAHHGGR